MTRQKASEKSLRRFSLQIKSWWRKFHHHASTILPKRYSCIYKQKRIFHHNFSRTNTNSTKLFNIIQEHTTQSTSKNIIDKGNDSLSRESLRYTIWYLFHISTPSLVSLLYRSVTFLSNRKFFFSLAIPFLWHSLNRRALQVWFDLI